MRPQQTNIDRQPQQIHTDNSLQICGLNRLTLTDSLNRFTLITHYNMQPQHIHTGSSLLRVCNLNIFTLAAHYYEYATSTYSHWQLTTTSMQPQHIHTGSSLLRVCNLNIFTLAAHYYELTSNIQLTHYYGCNYIFWVWLFLGCMQPQHIHWQLTTTSMNLNIFTLAAHYYGMQPQHIHTGSSLTVCNLTYSHWRSLLRYDLNIFTLAAHYYEYATSTYSHWQLTTTRYSATRARHGNRPPRCLLFATPRPFFEKHMFSSLTQILAGYTVSDSLSFTPKICLGLRQNCIHDESLLRWNVTQRDVNKIMFYCESQSG
ncbi:hypothetical protein J6590_033741 [Homalodisca vitripennis]|nr:hypothetical protein J6590_033741 [Homalodisca vitripennis]